MNFRTILEIENDIQNKQTELDQTTHEIGRSILINAIADLEIEKKNAEEALSQQERVQAQTDAVESITLPLDFNDLFDNPLANETIIEVVKQFQLQAYEEHNAEVAQINANWQHQIQQALTIELDQKGRIIELQNELLSSQNDFDELQTLNSTALVEKKDAEFTRDNAVRMLEEKNVEYGALLLTHEKLGYDYATVQNKILELQQELTAKKAITVSGNEKLAELAAKAKESTAAAAQRGIDRWNEKYGMDIPVLATPDILPVNPVSEEEATTKEDTFQSEVQTSDSGTNTETTGNENVEPMVGQSESEVITLESLKNEVDAIKTYLGMVA